MAKTESRFATFGFLDEVHAKFPKNAEHYNRNVPRRDISEPYLQAQIVTRGNFMLPKTVRQYRVIAVVIIRVTQFISIINNTEVCFCLP